MIRRTCMGFLSLILLMGLSAVPASAEEWGHPDKRGDGFTGGDIVQLSATNGFNTVLVRVHFADLIRRNINSSFLVIDTQRRDGTDYMLFTKWTPNGYRNTLVRTIPFSDADATTIRCPGLDVDWKLSVDRIVMHVPQTCLSDDDNLRVGYDVENGTTDDWAPGRYASYSPWIYMGGGAW